MMHKLERRAIRAVIKSLRTEPDMWTTDCFHARHVSKPFKVWIANSTYGLHVEVNGYRIGNVTACSTFFGRLIPWRARLYSAAMNIKRMETLRKAEAALGEFQ